MTLTSLCFLGVASFDALGPLVTAGGLAVFTVFLFLMLSRTPPSEPMRKCVLLSLCVHALLALYATSVPFIPMLGLARVINPFAEERIAITRIEAPIGDQSVESPKDAAADNGEAAAPNQRKSTAPWDELPGTESPRATPPELPKSETHVASAVNRRDLRSNTPPPLARSPAFSAQEAADAARDATPPKREAVVAPEAADAPNIVAESAPKMTAPAAEPTRPSTPESVASPAEPRPVQPDKKTLPAATPVAAPAEVAPRAKTEPAEPATIAASDTSIQRRPAADAGALPDPAAMKPELAAPPAPSGAEPLTGPTTPAEVARSTTAEPGLPNGSALASVPSLPPLATPGVTPLTRKARTTSDDVPDVYKLRMEPKRAETLEELGASTETEAAVQAALGWLASAQSADGRWDALRYGAGLENRIDGHNRENAGARSDMGVTGLALLAFLGAGQTHQAGEYRENVRRGINFLVSRQTSGGCLAGDAAQFEFMYCHAMAAFALSECWALTRDPRLEAPVRRAINYTLYAQHEGGSWRYYPKQEGDTSVLGWQVMVLESAHVGGIPIPTSTRDGIERYLGSVAKGRFGGRASYRPIENATRTMTAEALVCRQFLGMPLSEQAEREAVDFLLAELPGQGEVNDYYWYYASLALHERGGADWDRWNEALQRTLVSRQRKSGPQAGSFDPQGVWGGHGGRVYSTAIAVLSLEVYYRYQHHGVNARPDRDAVRQADRTR